MIFVYRTGWGKGTSAVGLVRADTEEQAKQKVKGEGGYFVNVTQVDDKYFEAEKSDVVELEDRP
jgi:hypothetical protein